MQFKANNGVLVIDDFGRHKMSPTELLNRWIVPLDRSIDYLSLSGGRKFEMPFVIFVIFSTNLNPSSLADDAFIRRIQNKIMVDEVTREQFWKITERVCASAEVACNDTLIIYLTDLILNEIKEPLRPCYPRDIVRQITNVAQYNRTQPILDKASISMACRNYFVSH